MVKRATRVNIAGKKGAIKSCISTVSLQAGRILPTGLAYAIGRLKPITTVTRCQYENFRVNGSALSPKRLPSGLLFFGFNTRKEEWINSSRMRQFIYWFYGLPNIGRYFSGVILSIHIVGMTWWRSCITSSQKCSIGASGVVQRVVSG
jgi:hypothetical protein